jgi:predicted transcriptional regulator of viral defense system
LPIYLYRTKKGETPMKTLNASEYQKLLTPKYIAIEAFGIISFFSALVWHFS